MKRSLLSLLFFMVSLSAFSQNYRVIYAVVPNKEEYQNLQDPVVRQRVESRLEKIKNYRFELLVAGDKAKYAFYEHDLLPEGYRKPTSKFYYLEGKMIEHADVFNDTYFIERPIDLYQWTITDETMEINGYVCYRAFTKRDAYMLGHKVYNVEAWFCPDFPMKYGPQYCFGLPGLVFATSFENGATRYVLEKIEILQEAPDLQIPNIQKTWQEKEAAEFLTKKLRQGGRR